MPRKVWVPFLKETDSEHSKRLHSNETVYLIMYILLFDSISAYFNLVPHFLSLYNVIELSFIINFNLYNI